MPNLEMCRICLGEETCINDMEKLFDNKSSNRSDILKRIEMCVGMALKIDDKLPKMICSQCLDSLNTSYRFRLMCQSSEQVLVELIAQPGEKTEPSDAEETEEQEEEGQKEVNVENGENEEKQDDDKFYDFCNEYVDEVQDEVEDNNDTYYAPEDNDDDDGDAEEYMPYSDTDGDSEYMTEYMTDDDYDYLPVQNKKKRLTKKVNKNKDDVFEGNGNSDECDECGDVRLEKQLVENLFF